MRCLRLLLQTHRDRRRLRDLEHALDMAKARHYVAAETQQQTIDQLKQEVHDLRNELAAAKHREYRMRRGLPCDFPPD